ncbi:MAG: carbohydrate-binding protein [Turicibacter sp.]|nr:carbohydrate-binding protein [Turicibacter sp.]
MKIKLFEISGENQKTSQVVATTLALATLLVQVTPALNVRASNIPNEAVIASNNYVEWDVAAIYGEGDRVSFNGSVFQAQWWTQNQEPGVSPHGSWMEMSYNDFGLPIWTESRVFDIGDLVYHEGDVFTAKWWSRNNNPNGDYGSFKNIGSIEDFKLPFTYQVIREYDNFVSVNELGLFYINSLGYLRLSWGERQDLDAVIEQTNYAVLSKITDIENFEGIDYFIGDAGVTFFYMDETPAPRNHGVTRVQFTWWGGLRIYLSRDVARATVSTGMTVLSIKFPGLGKAWRFATPWSGFVINRGVVFEMLTVIPINWAWQ